LSKINFLIILCFALTIFMIGMCEEEGCESPGKVWYVGCNKCICQSDNYTSACEMDPSKCK
jgi:hypothetical protein